MLTGTDIDKNHRNAMNEWLQKAGDIEDSCKSVSVGGLMNSMRIRQFDQENYDMLKEIYQENHINRNVDALLEEMAELAVLVLHIRRNRAWKKEELTSEIADIEQCLSFVKKDFNITENEMQEQYRLKNDKFKASLKRCLLNDNDSYEKAKH